MNAFSKGYVSQIKTTLADKLSAKSSASSTARRERAMQSDDPVVRAWASGFMPGIGKADPATTQKIRRGSSNMGAGK